MIRGWMGLSGLFLSLAAVSEEYRPSDIPGWQHIIFSGQTEYQQTDECTAARASQSASGLIRQVDQSLLEKPILSWQWRAVEPLSVGQAAPEKTRAGDDFVARVYVIREGLFPWQTKAINYVWSREHPVGSHWPNPFTRNAMMVVLQSGEQGLGKWHHFSRDVRADFQHYFALNVSVVNAVAVMTDTDNTGGQASACYQLPSFGEARS